jgi:hypothetical protein
VDLADQEWEKTDWTRQQAEQVLGSIDTKLMDAGAVETREERTLAPSGVAGFQKPLQTEKTKAVSSKFAAEAFFRCPNVNKSLTTFPPYLVRSVELQTSCFWDGIYPITASKSETDTGALSAPNTAIFGGDVTTLDRNHLFDQGSLICWRDLILGRQRKYSIGNDSTL